MTDIVTLIAEQFWGIITGIIVSLTVYIIVTFIPIKEHARYKATFYRRKLSKWISNPPIKTSYVTKSGNLEEKELRVTDLMKSVKQKLCQNNFHFKGEKGTSIIFNYISGKTEIELTLTPSYQATEEEGELIVDYLECNFKLIRNRYKDFNGHLLDLIQTFRRLDSSLKEVVGEWRGESLTCEIKRLYEFVGVLKDLKMSSLKGKMGGQYEIEMFEKHLIVYGEIETKMTELLKDVITYYY
jgi:hypothetical protein